MCPYDDSHLVDALPPSLALLSSPENSPAGLLLLAAYKKKRTSKGTVNTVKCKDIACRARANKEGGREGGGVKLGEVKCFKPDAEVL